MTQRVCLSIGAGPNKGLPPHYRDFAVVTMDIDPATRPDIVADVRDLSSVDPASFDAVYMAHLLEHFERHELATVLREVVRVLRPGGFVEVRVPHVGAVCEAVAAGTGLDEPLYESAMGPITPHDVLFGHGPSLAAGNTFMAHRTAFTEPLLSKTLSDAGLRIEYVKRAPGTRFELCGIGRRTVDA